MYWVGLCSLTVQHQGEGWPSKTGQLIRERSTRWLAKKKPKGCKRAWGSQVGLVFFLGGFQGDPDWRIRLPVSDFWLVLTQSLDVYKDELIICYSEAGITATAGLNSCYIESIVRKGDDIYYLTVTCLIVNVWFMPDALSDATKKENKCVATWIFLWNIWPLQKCHHYISQHDWEYFTNSQEGGLYGSYVGLDLRVMTSNLIMWPYSYEQIPEDSGLEPKR